ncbi:hypothetical protein CLOSTASPAR_03543 [[Clostridium] asparagiforme DSM 15981]|uniref:Uncharacterized protein n=1 Tax=[Clostridium] asparagiforme DSM 15981 TaxID=518636 RepID=C0D2Q4_9FIRM|nr:hypothetical protein CLOSTASPAR_03543 [[Clostridium] asparagiforme DSM 15981]
MTLKQDGKETRKRIRSSFFDAKGKIGKIRGIGCINMKNLLNGAGPGRFWTI